MIFIKDVLHQATVRFCIKPVCRIRLETGSKFVFLQFVFLHQVELHFTLRICNNYYSLYTLMCSFQLLHLIHPCADHGAITKTEEDRSDNLRGQKSPEINPRVDLPKAWCWGLNGASHPSPDLLYSRISESGFEYNGESNIKHHIYIWKCLTLHCGGCRANE